MNNRKGITYLVFIAILITMAASFFIIYQKYVMKADIEVGPYIWKNQATVTFNDQISNSNTVYFKQIWFGLISLGGRWWDNDIPVLLEIKQGDTLIVSGNFESEYDGSIQIDPTTLNLQNELKGTYDVYIKPSGYLAKRATITFPLTNETLFSFSEAAEDQFKPGDFSGDNKVDLADISIWLASYKKSAFQDPRDVNGDGFIDLADLSIILGSYSKRGE